ncbi:MAG: hypothetical protein J7457_05500 [Roseiflexus sp.]|nr:hypothetical protein [Roseiflexus sp.]
MIALFLASFALLTALLTLVRLHLGIANEDGSHDPATPFVIDDPTLAQAIYGRLSAAAPVAYYTFTVPDAISVRVMLLIPSRDCQSGFMARFALVGPGLPSGRLFPTTHFTPLTIAGRTYRLIQSYVPPLPSAGTYWIEVHCDAGSGVYCLCIGTREGGHADAAMRARIERMLEG